MLRSVVVIEQREVDRVAHLAIAAVAWVQAVATIVDRSHLGRDLGFAQRGIEIGDTVERLGQRRRVGGVAAQVARIRTVSVDPEIDE